MFRIEWKFKFADKVHTQEIPLKEDADLLTSELQNSTIVAWVCVITPDGETLWY